jgi:hypothetical protein
MAARMMICAIMAGDSIVVAGERGLEPVQQTGLEKGHEIPGSGRAVFSPRE